MMNLLLIIDMWMVQITAHDGCMDGAWLRRDNERKNEWKGESQRWWRTARTKVFGCQSSLELKGETWGAGSADHRPNKLRFWFCYLYKKITVKSTVDSKLQSRFSLWDFMQVLRSGNNPYEKRTLCLSVSLAVSPFCAAVLERRQESYQVNKSCAFIWVIWPCLCKTIDFASAVCVNSNWALDKRGFAP